LSRQVSNVALATRPISHDLLTCIIRALLAIAHSLASRLGRHCASASIAEQQPLEDELMFVKGFPAKIGQIPAGKRLIGVFPDLFTDQRFPNSLVFVLIGNSIVPI
jgi:hypothetical protein|tara:strand:+ start:464 stop:781 length:318 start_codon:yes stop_codon:yes gene_type:complete